VINRGGNKVFPGDVEEVLRLSPEVDDAGVVGVPDPRLGEVPVAFVTGQPVAAGELERRCREHLAPYKVPVAFHHLDALPRNEVGKLLRAALVDRHSAMGKGHHSTRRANVIGSDTIYWDPYDIEIDTDPYDIWRRLRDDAPVYRNDRFDFWALSRFTDVQAAHRDPKRFLSSHTTVLELMGPDPSTAGQMMIFLDPPSHGRLRELVSRAFTPRRVAELEDQVRLICAGYLDPYIGGGGFDYVQDFGAQLPSNVISALMGVPDADREHVRHLIDTVFHIEPGAGMINDISFGAQISLNTYFRDQLDERRHHPRDDMFTALLEAEIVDDSGETRRLTSAEAADFANLIVSAGTETVARLLGWAAVVLDGHPDQRTELASDPSLIPNAVEELLRYEAPSPVQGRWTADDIELHGDVIPKDSKVLLLTGSAGRDERVYPQAEQFDIHRSFDQHVSFGYGIHFCLGAALARLEGKVALEETLKRFPWWEVDRGQAVRLHTSTVRGWHQVPVRI
jgi:cytochrome P450